GGRQRLRRRQRRTGGEQIDCGHRTASLTRTTFQSASAAVTCQRRGTAPRTPSLRCDPRQCDNRKDRQRRRRKKKPEGGQPRGGSGPDTIPGRIKPKATATAGLKQGLSLERDEIRRRRIH